MRSPYPKYRAGRPRASLCHRHRRCWCLRCRLASFVIAAAATAVVAAISAATPASVAIAAIAVAATIAAVAAIAGAAADATAAAVAAIAAAPLRHCRGRRRKCRRWQAAAAIAPGVIAATIAAAPVATAVAITTAVAAVAAATTPSPAIADAVARPPDVPNGRLAPGRPGVRGGICCSQGLSWRAQRAQPKRGVGMDRHMERHSQEFGGLAGRWGRGVHLGGHGVGRRGGAVASSRHWR